MRGIRLLIKNAFKSAFRNFYQIIGLSMLILLVSLIASLITSTSSAVIDASNNLQTQSNLRDAVVEIDSSKINIDSDHLPVTPIDNWTVKMTSVTKTEDKITAAITTAFEKATPKSVVYQTTTDENGNTTASTDIDWDKTEFTIDWGNAFDADGGSYKKGENITVAAKENAKYISGSFIIVTGATTAEYTPTNSIQEIAQQKLIEKVLEDTYHGKATWTRTEGRTLTEVKNNGIELLIKAVAKYGNTTELNQASATTDKLIITDGKQFSDDANVSMHQTVLQKTFAEAHNIKVGDIVRYTVDSVGNQNELVVTKDKTVKNNLKTDLKGKSWSEAFDKTRYATMNWFEVVGFGVSSDFTAPIIDQTTTLPNIKKDLIAYVDPRVFGFTKAVSASGEVTPSYLPADATLTLVSNYDREVYYSLSLPADKAEDFADTLNTKIKSAFGINTDAKVVYSNDDSDYTYYERTHMFETVSDVFTIMTTILLVVIAAIAAATIILMTIKYVETIQKQIGCLKALGYKKREVVNNFIALPLISSAIGCIIGYLTSIGVGQGVLLGFKQYFNVDFGGISFDIASFALSIFAIFLIMLTITYIAAYVIIRRSPLSLLKGDADRQSSPIARGLKKMTLSKKFDGRLRGALMASSAGKLLGMSGVILLSTILMSATAIAPKIMEDNENKSFDGINYANSVEYTDPLWNNPVSFFRTFNPVYDQTSATADGWGFTDVDGNTKQSVNNLIVDLGGKSVDPLVSQTAVSPLPTTNDGQIDVEKVLQSLYDENISSNYYSYEIQDGNDYANSPSTMKPIVGQGWSKMAYLAWTTLGIPYLKALNTIPPGSTTIIGTLKLQWADYTEMETMVKSLASIDLSNASTLDEDDKATVQEVFEYLVSWYKKYSSGLPIDYTSDPNATADAPESSTYLKAFPAYAAFKKLSNIEELYNQYQPTSTNPSKGTFTINGEDVNVGELNPTDVSRTDDYVKYIVAISRWINGTFFNKLGSILIETSYSRAPYFVQQKMKKAYQNGDDYSLSFNVNPYNPETDDLGTMINAQYKNTKGEWQDFKVYGIDADQKTIDLDYNALAKNESSENVVPIIINNTAKIKGNLSVGDTVDMNYFVSELANKAGESATLKGVDCPTGDSCSTANETDMSLNSFKYLSEDSTGYDVTVPETEHVNEYYAPDSALTYYSLDGGYPSNSMGGIESAKIAGSNIAAESSKSSTTALDSLVDATNGDIKISSNLKNAKFKIVGVQSSYGKAQGWITNTDANHLLHYDLTEEYMYENLFVPQFRNLFTKGYDEVGGFLTDEVDLTTVPTLTELIAKASSNDNFAKVLKLFNNMYPIFNYKNSLDSNNYDLDSVVITSQSFGDYSSVGLNGGTFDTGASYTGFGQGGTSLIYPVTTARQILEQITTLVDLVIILFIIIAFIVSLTMIILTTSLVIKENIAFIATMKILGYSNRYIVRQILGMYITGIIIAFIAGFLVSWFGIVGLGHVLATNSSWVLPISFYWWYPFAVFGLLGAVYVASSAVGFAAIRKVHPLLALQYEK